MKKWTNQLEEVEEDLHVEEEEDVVDLLEMAKEEVKDRQSEVQEGEVLKIKVEIQAHLPEEVEEEVEAEEKKIVIKNLKIRL